MIEPEYSSEYMLRLARTAKQNIFLSAKDMLLKRLFKQA
jgi:hypothetical protein